MIKTDSRRHIFFICRSRSTSLGIYQHKKHLYWLYGWSWHCHNYTEDTSEGVEQDSTHEFWVLLLWNVPEVCKVDCNILTAGCRHFVCLLPVWRISPLTTQGETGIKTVEFTINWTLYCFKSLQIHKEWLFTSFRTVQGERTVRNLPRNLKLSCCVQKRVHSISRDPTKGIA